MRYRQPFEALLAALRAHPHIDVQQAVIQPGVEPSRVRAIAAEVKQRHGIEIPPSLLDLYAEMDGFTLVWEPRSSVRVDGRPWTIPPCFNHLRPLNSLRFGDRAEELQCRDDETAQASAALKFFDDHDQEDDGAWLVAIDGATHLYGVHAQGECVDRIDLDFDAYFARLLALRGFFGWQRQVRSYDESRHGDVSRFEETQRWYVQWMEALSLTP